MNNWICNLYAHNNDEEHTTIYLHVVSSSFQLALWRKQLCTHGPKWNIRGENLPSTVGTANQPGRKMPFKLNELTIHYPSDLFIVWGCNTFLPSTRSPICHNTWPPLPLVGDWAQAHCSKCSYGTASTPAPSNHAIKLYVYLKRKIDCSSVINIIVHYILLHCSGTR